MKTITIIVFMIMSLFVNSQELPDKFTIEEDIVSIGTDFSLQGCNGDIDENLVSLTPSFTLKIDGLSVAKATEQLISIGAKINVYDGSGNKIGSIEERIINSWGVYSKYSVYDKNDRLIGTSEKHELMTTKFTINDNNGNTICTITRPYFNPLYDKWTVTFSSSRYDKRLFVFIPCYKTYRDNEDGDDNDDNDDD